MLVIYPKDKTTAMLSALYDGLEALRPQCRAPQGAAAAGMGEFFQYNMKNV